MIDPNNKNFEKNQKDSFKMKNHEVKNLDLTKEEIELFLKLSQKQNDLEYDR